MCMQLTTAKKLNFILLLIVCCNETLKSSLKSAIKQESFFLKAASQNSKDNIWRAFFKKCQKNRKNKFISPAQNRCKIWDATNISNAYFLSIGRWVMVDVWLKRQHSKSKKICAFFSGARMTTLIGLNS